MTTHNYSYATARASFLSLLKNASLTSYLHPLPGPDGEIAMDVACWGKTDAQRVLVISSGTHGIEGYCGSFVQCELLAQGFEKNLPEDMMLMMIHAVNPHGFAWQRRVNEDNIDLNRNFIDYSQPLPANKGYRELATVLEPKSWSDQTAADIRQHLQKISAEHDNSERWQQAAMTGGQYEYSNGIFYGGVEPSWSNLRISQLAETQLAGRDVIWVDIHTALGRYGEAECIVEYEANDPKLERAKSLWGERVLSTRTGESLSSDVSGSMCAGVGRQLTDRLLATGLEYGTRPSSQVLGALIADQWLHCHGELQSSQGQEIKRMMMDAFYPDESKWRKAVLDIAKKVITPLLEENRTNV